MRPLLLIPLAILPACLSSPEGLIQPPAIGIWPPPDVALDITAARVADLDRDGIDDLVLASKVPDAPALYVLLGSLDGIGAGLHAQVTPSVPPLALDVGDVSGDGLADLVAFGGDKFLQRIEAFPATAAFTFGPAWRKELVTLSSLEVNPRSPRVDVLDFEGDGFADLVLADEQHAETARMMSATEVGFVDMSLERLPIVESFGGTSSSFLADGSAGGRDLVVVTMHRTFVYSRIAAGQQAPPAQITNSGGFTVHARCDLDGDGALEVIGGHGGWAAVKPSDLSGIFDYNNSPLFPVDRGVPAAVCAELDRAPAGRPDFAVLQQPDDSGVVVWVLSDLYLEADPRQLLTSRQAILELPLPGVDAVVMVAGDFDGDDALELLVVARDGAISCLTVGTDAITPCAL